ncbi:MAG TPA: CpsB/CapC family capsule biosynthesis tyrosine phosphatase [Thermoanaerobaculia bacterium]|nr:CpsB/CapC family capsule biosynthesis tyrosine phosphatase [Thermoanaerobaculia bacterium]
MIDIHFHCLPGIDDGPRDWDEAVALCNAAAEDGVETIVATPHVLRDDWVNDDIAARSALVAELNRRLGGHPTILAGCEYYFSSDAVELCQAGSPLTMLNGSSYLLLEFPPTRLPESAESVFHELSLIGVRPVIAHPERHLVLAAQPEKLQRLVDLGAIVQVTSASVIGEFGRAAASAALDMLDRGLVHVIASDSHSVNRRPPRMSAAREKIRREWPAEVETALFDTNPRAVIEGRPLTQGFVANDL